MAGAEVDSTAARAAITCYMTVAETMIPSIGRPFWHPVLGWSVL